MPLSTFEKGNRDLSRLCIHTITTKPWDIHTAIRKYSDAGIGGISIWQDAVEGKNLSNIKAELASANLEPVSLVRGGFYTGNLEARKKAIEDNIKIIDTAAAVGAPMVVLVCGATPGQSVAEDLNQITHGIEATLDHAKACGVKLAIEPLHPMYADIRSSVSTIKAANDICDELKSEQLGLAVDVFHVWWDPEYEKELKRCGDANNILAYHICDWKVDMSDMLNDRGLMGEGIIDLKKMSSGIEEAGFNGFFEVEVFSNSYWSQDQDLYLEKIIKSYQETC